MHFTTSTSNLKSLVKLAMVGLAIVSVGCEPAPKPAPKDAASASDHGHEHPETLAAAVTELESVCATIKAAYAKDDSEAAHGPLHDVGHLLEQVPALIETSSLDAAGKEEAKKATESLFQAFGDVDKGMHGEEGKKYSEVSDAVDAALKTLSEKAKN